MQNEALYKKGLKIRREVLGKKFDTEILGGEDDFSVPLREFTTKYVWGEIWSRKGLPRRTRSLVNIGILTALKCPFELRGHIRAALNNGCTKTEIREVLFQSTVYCGVPAMREALRAARAVFAERRK